MIYDSVLEMVGSTPMVRVTGLDTGPCELYLKLELMNPGGSIKDRIGMSMIEEAEKRGELTPGDTIVEATAGNTGLGLALVAARKGYKLILVIPDKMSQEKDTRSITRTWDDGWPRSAAPISLTSSATRTIPRPITTARPRRSGVIWITGWMPWW
jgi:hypothetical protein